MIGSDFWKGKKFNPSSGSLLAQLHDLSFRSRFCIITPLPQKLFLSCLYLLLPTCFLCEAVPTRWTPSLRPPCPSCRRSLCMCRRARERCLLY
jgi:hypothetical protein